MKLITCLALILVPGILIAGCGESDRELASTVALSDPEIVWSSLGMAGIGFALTNRTDQDIVLTQIRLLVDDRTPETEEGDTESCPGTKIEFGDLYFNISRDSPDHGLKVFGPLGGEAPVTELTLPADSTRTVEAIVFNHLHPAETGREVDACRVRVQVELDGATTTSPPMEIHFNAPGL